MAVLSTLGGLTAGLCSGAMWHNKVLPIYEGFFRRVHKFCEEHIYANVHDAATEVYVPSDLPDSTVERKHISKFTTVWSRIVSGEAATHEVDRELPAPLAATHREQEVAVPETSTKAAEIAALEMSNEEHCDSIKHLLEDVKAPETSAEEVERILTELDMRTTSVTCEQLMASVPKDLPRSRSFMLKAVGIWGLALKYADETLRSDPEVVFTAVRQRPLALRFAADVLRRDRCFILDVVKLSGFALEYADPQFKLDEEIAVVAGRTSPKMQQVLFPIPKNGQEACANFNNDVLRFDGFNEHAYRFLFHWGAKFQDGQEAGPWRLKTVLPTGHIENDKDLKPNSEGGLVCFTHHQSIDARNVEELAQTPFVWQRPDGSYAVVQTWKVAINEQFQKTFTITSENPNERTFGVQAAEEFKMALAGLFGDDVVRDLGIKYCHKVTHNAKLALVGSSEKLMEFIKSDATVRQELDLLEVGKDAHGDQPLSFVCRGVDGKGNVFPKSFTMSPNTMYVVYVKQGWETMACAKPLHQFEKECAFTTPPKKCSL